MFDPVFDLANLLLTALVLLVVGFLIFVVVLVMWALQLGVL